MSIGHHMHFSVSWIQSWGSRCEICNLIKWCPPALSSCFHFPYGSIWEPALQHSHPLQICYNSLFACMQVCRPAQILSYPWWALVVTFQVLIQWATKPMQCLHDFDWWVNIGRPIDARPLHMGTVRKLWSRAFQTYIHWVGNSDSIRNYSGIKQGYSLHQFCCWQFEVWKLYDEIRYYIINGSCDTL